MNVKNRNIVEKAVLLFSMSLMGIQILIGFFWMFKNIMVIPCFGDSTEYLNLSQNMRLDEYRPVLYPLILNIILKIGEFTKTPYQIWLYVMQTIISFASITYGIFTLDGMILGKEWNTKKRAGLLVFISLYLMTIPMITFMNFSVLTDSLATSMLVLFLTGLVIMLGKDKVPVWSYVLITFSLTAESLLRADRLYSCLLLAVIVMGIRIWKNHSYRRQVACAMCIACLSGLFLVQGVKALTQTPGLNGRTQTNLDFVLLDRIVWRNMTANYASFPDEIREVITIEEAQVFDEHNNNAMYQMAPLMDSRVGKENARRMYRTMAAIVFDNQTKKVLKDIGEDVLAMAATPISSLLNTYYLCEKADSWNIYCMSTKEPELTMCYNRYCLYVFMIILSLGICLTIYRTIRRKKQTVKLLLNKIMPYIGMGIILTLWFSLGDGAPPNDRYALLIYLDWFLVAVGMLGLL